MRAAIAGGLLLVACLAPYLIPVAFYSGPKNLALTQVDIGGESSLSATLRFSARLLSQGRVACVLTQ